MGIPNAKIEKVMFSFFREESAAISGAGKLSCLFCVGCHLLFECVTNKHSPKMYFVCCRRLSLIFPFDKVDVSQVCKFLSVGAP